MSRRRWAVMTREAGQCYQLDTFRTRGEAEREASLLRGSADGPVWVESLDGAS